MIVGGGLAILAGGVLGRDWLTRLGGLVTVPVMFGAIALVHWGKWSFVATDGQSMGGMEFQVVLLLMGLYFAARGNGETFGEPQAKGSRSGASGARPGAERLRPFFVVRAERSNNISDKCLAYAYLKCSGFRS